MTKQEAVEVAKKLKVLAEKSVGGERDAALSKLKALCTKYHLDADEFETEQIKVSIRYGSEHERLLLSNVLCMVMETDQVRGKIVDSAYVFSCTPRQFEDIKDAFAYYKKVMNDYIDSFLIALVTKNQIANRKPTKDDFTFEQMTVEERQQFDAEYAKTAPQEDPQSDQEDVQQEQPSQHQSTPKSPTPTEDDENRKRDRIQRMLFVIDVPQWTPKPKVKYFLS